jgi:hypothetical protein
MYTCTSIVVRVAFYSVYASHNNKVLLVSLVLLNIRGLVTPFAYMYVLQMCVMGKRKPHLCISVLLGASEIYPFI